MDKENVGCMCNGIFNHKKQGNPAICNMDGPRGHYAKWNKSEKDKYHMFHSNVESEKKKSEETKQMDAYIQRTSWWLPEEREVGRMGEISKGN